MLEKPLAALGIAGIAIGIMIDIVFVRITVCKNTHFKQMQRTLLKLEDSSRRTLKSYSLFGC